jgi:IMP dehydrogenase
MISKSSLHSLSYKDVLLLPQYSEINSRDDVNLFLENEKYMNIFSAPMKNISEPSFVIALGKLGGVGVLHRFFDTNQERYQAVEAIASNCDIYGVSIGIHDFGEELDFVKFAVDKHCNFVCIDTASAYHRNTLEAVRQLSEFRRNNNLYFDIIAGNVVDATGCANLVKYGANIIRMNIGTGLQCLTSTSIGIGCPSLTAISDCAKIKKQYPNITLLADGGIYTPGDALKALAFGASGLMIGSLFGRAKECENNGIIFGMSSFALQERMNKTKKSNEGTVTLIPKEEIRPLKEIFSEFAYGLKSGLSYLGCDDINKLDKINVEYVDLKA